MISENISYEIFQSWMSLSTENYKLEQQLLSAKDEALKDDIQQKLTDNEESMKGYFPKTHGEVCSYRAYIANEVEALKINYFALNHPAKAEKLGVFLPDDVTEDSLNLQTEALKIIVDKVTDISATMETTDYMFKNTQPTGTFSVQDIK